MTRRGTNLPPREEYLLVSTTRHYLVKKIVIVNRMVKLTLSMKNITQTAVTNMEQRTLLIFQYICYVFNEAEMTKKEKYLSMKFKGL